MTLADEYAKDWAAASASFAMGDISGVHAALVGSGPDGPDDGTWAFQRNASLIATGAMITASVIAEDAGVPQGCGLWYAPITNDMSELAAMTNELVVASLNGANSLPEMITEYQLKHGSGLSVGLLVTMLKYYIGVVAAIAARESR